MSRSLFALIFAVIVVLIFVGMWFGWRARSRRDQHVAAPRAAFTGELITALTRVMYVSTTPVGDPLSRVAAPGLRYRGLADVTVYTDGVEIQVTGEEPVRLASAQLSGTGTARVRVGKAVERNGLTLLLWNDSDKAYESTFRFEEIDTEREFAAAISQITQLSNDAQQAHLETQNFSHITQEDAR